MTVIDFDRRSFDRVCVELDCDLEAAPRKQRCHECWLAAQPPVVRADAAKRRLSLVPEPVRQARVPDKLWPQGRRWCAGCQSFVRLRDAGGSRCKACNSIATHKSRVASRFGIDDETYQWLLDTQLGKCAICRCRPKTTRFAVDHDHKHCETGCPECVRGLVCSRCNHELLGAAHDSIHILRNAVAYLEHPPMRGEWSVPQFEVDQWREKYGDTPVAPF